MGWFLGPNKFLNKSLTTNNKHLKFDTLKPSSLLGTRKTMNKSRIRQDRMSMHLHKNRNTFPNYHNHYSNHLKKKTFLRSAFKPSRPLSLNPLTASTMAKSQCVIAAADKHTRELSEPEPKMLQNALALPIDLIFVFFCSHLLFRLVSHA